MRPARMCMFVFWLVALTLLLLGAAQKPRYGIEVVETLKPIILDVYPKILVAGLTSAEVRATWRIARHPDNRSFSFVLNSDNGHYELSSGEVKGEDSPVLFPVCTNENPRPCYRRVHSGNYVMEACVYRTNHKRYCDRATLEVK